MVICYRSINGGTTFSYLYGVNGAWTTPFLMHPSNPKILYTANKKIMKSTNGGNTFQIISGTSNVAPLFISSMAQSQVNPNNMIFGTGLDHPHYDTVFVVKVSSDEGLSWTDVTANIPGESRWISRVVSDPVDASTMYIVRTGFSEANKVWKTTDLGQTWVNISGNLPDLPCSDLFIDPDNTDHLYIANDIGIYVTLNRGINWEYGSQGMPFVPVIDFDYVKIGEVKYLRAGTHGRSIYQTSIMGVGVEEPDLPVSTNIGEVVIQNYPNPFSYKTTIEYTLPEDSWLTLELFSIHGTKIASLINEFKEKGQHQLTFKQSELPAGIYFYRLMAGNKFASGKMVLMK